MFPLVFSCLTVYTCFAQNLRIYCIDVEQGDATLIVTPAQKTVVIDSGRNDNRGSRISNLLNGLGISRINYLITTHYDMDHFGGADYLINNIAGIYKVYARGTPSSRSQDYNNYRNALSSKGINPTTISASPSTEFTLDGVRQGRLCKWTAVKW